MKQFVVTEKQFSELIDSGLSLKQIGTKTLDVQKLKFKTGVSRKVDYESREIGGKMVENAVALVTETDVYKEKEVKVTGVIFECLSEDDEAKVQKVLA